MAETETTITSDEDNVGALIEAWASLVRRLAGHTVERLDGVATTFGHVPLSFLNLSTLDRPMADATDFRRALGVARERAKACEHPSMVAVCPNWAPPRWRSLMAEEGLEPVMNMTGMAAGALAPPRRGPPPMDCRLVSDLATATDIAVINAHAYGMPVELVDCICNLDLWTEGSFGVVGYVAGEAVTCTAAYLIGDMIYIALVATLPSAHGKGYAEAVMRRAIQYAQDAAGPKRIWLHASDMGRPLYASMGFETGAELPLFEFADGSSTH
jgi:GNAT superfamily N-acetyltransferase